MAENKEDYYSAAELMVQVKSFFHYLLRKSWLLLLAIAIGGGLGAVYYYKQKPKYKSATTFILEEKTSGGGGLAGLASQFGINVGGMSGGSMFSGDNILSILMSKKVIQQVLLTSVNNKAPDSKALADMYLDFTGIRKGWQERKDFVDFSFAKVAKQMTPVQDSILNDIYEAVIKKTLQTERTTKQGTIIKVTATAGDRLFAHLLSERLVEEASRLYLEVKTSNAQANIDQLQRRSDSLLSLLNRKSYTAAVSQPLDFNPGIKSAFVPTEIATRDKAVLGTLYAEVTKSLEMSKLMLTQQTPVIQVLDKSPLLLSDNKKGLVFILIVFSFITGAFCFIGLCALYFFSRSKKA